MIEADRVLSTPPLNTSVSLSRRNMLAGLAALPAAGPAIATAAVDPLFDLIDAHRVAQVAHLAAIHEAGRLEGLHGGYYGDITAKPCDDENDAWAALLETAAITLWMLDDRVALLLLDSFAASLKNIGVLS